MRSATSPLDDRLTWEAEYPRQSSMVEPWTVDAIVPMMTDAHAFFILRNLLAGE